MRVAAAGGLNFYWWCDGSSEILAAALYPEEAMKNLALKVQRFLVSEDGPTAVEYAVMLALIVVVCLTTISTLGTRANATFDSVAQKLPAGAAA